MKYKYKRPKDFWFYQIVLFILIGLFGFIILRESIKLYFGYTNKALIMLIIFILIILGVLFIIYQIVKIFNEYDLIDRNKEVRINDENAQVEIVQNSIKTVITKENIKHVRIYESWAATYPLGYFKYIEFLLNTGDHILITSFTLPDFALNLKLILKQSNPTKQKKFFNRINQLLLTSR